MKDIATSWSTSSDFSGGSNSNNNSPTTSISTSNTTTKSRKRNSCLPPSLSTQVKVIVIGLVMTALYTSVTNDIVNPIESSRWITTTTTASSNNNNNICPHALQFFDMHDLETSLERAQDFHQRGGSLKSIQLLLDDHIDTTVQKLGLTFFPNDNDGTAAAAASPSGTQNVTRYLRDYYATHHDARGGYGRLLPGTYHPPNHPLLLEGRYVEVADPTNSKERWDAALGPMGPNCTNLLEIGNPNTDGTKWLCQPKKHAQTTTETAMTTSATLHLLEQDPEHNKDNHDDDNNNNNCHVVSIGGNDNWHFEERLLQEMPHCTTHTFDCTLRGGKARKKPKDDRVRFYSACIHQTSHVDSHGRQYWTYFDILQQASLTEPPLLFKIDVEGFEYDIFSDMIQKSHHHGSLQLHNKPLSWWLPQQIVVELHWATRMNGVKWMPRTRTAAEIALLSNMMFTGGGYMPIFQFWTKYCPSCIEVLYFRTQCY